MREKENQPDTDTLTQEDKIESDDYFKEKLQEKIGERLVKQNVTDKVERIKCSFDIMWVSWLKRQKFKNFLNQDELRKLKHTVVFYYLLTWLENDLNSRQTIEEFANNPYNAEETEQYEDFEDLKTATKAIAYYEKFYRDNLALQNKQAVNEKIRYRRSSYRSRRNNKAAKYDFIALRFMETLQKGQLDIYKLLFLRKKRLKVIAPGKQDELIKAYKSYTEIATDVINEMNDRKYVVGCLHFVKFENTYRFMLAAHLARYMLKNNLSSEMEIPWKIRMTYIRILADEKYDKKASDTAFIGGYEDIEKDLLMPFSPYEFDKIVILRGIMESFLQFLFRIFPINSFGTWTDEDYKSARIFLQENYILEELVSFDFNEYPKDGMLFGHYVRSVYQNQSFMDQNYVVKGHEVLRKKNKKRNRKKPPNGK